MYQPFKNGFPKELRFPNINENNIMEFSVLWNWLQLYKVVKENKADLYALYDVYDTFVWNGYKTFQIAKNMLSSYISESEFTEWFLLQYSIKK